MALTAVVPHWNVFCDPMCGANALAFTSKHTAKFVAIGMDDAGPNDAGHYLGANLSGPCGIIGVVVLSHS